MESLPPFPLIVNLDFSNIITTIDPNVVNVMNPVKPKILNTETNELKTFEEVKISNIVGIYKFEPMLNMDAIFRLCQINSIGNISYMNYRGYSRGNRIESRKKKGNSKCVKCFKNSIGIDMGESLGLKLSQNSLWFSGAKSKESADEALRLLMVEINYVNENLNYINKYPEEAIKCVNFIKQSFEGDECFQIDGTRIIVNSSDVIMYGDEMYLNFNSKLYSILSKDLTVIPFNSIKSTLTNEIIKDDKGHQIMKIALKYPDAKRRVITDIKRVSKPGRRVYVASDKIPKTLNGYGISIISTSRGIITDEEARELNVGGEVLCQIW